MLMDVSASGLEYGKEHKTMASILLLQIKIRTGKILLCPRTREVPTIS